MKEEKIRELLSEYNYNKNTMEDTLDFLLMMCRFIVRLKGVKK